MKPEAKNLREKVEKLKEQFLNSQTELENYVNSCKHDFSKAIYDPIYHKSYTIPGDPPGTMGVDWRGPFYVPARTEDRWKRECKECGEVEYTKRIKEEVIKAPKW